MNAKKTKSQRLSTPAHWQVKALTVAIALDKAPMRKAFPGVILPSSPRNSVLNLSNMPENEQRDSAFADPPKHQVESAPTIGDGGIDCQDQRRLKASPQACDAVRTQNVLEGLPNGLAVRPSFKLLSCRDDGDGNRKELSESTSNSAK